MISIKNEKAWFLDFDKVANAFTSVKTWREKKYNTYKIFINHNVKHINNLQTRWTKAISSVLMPSPPEFGLTFYESHQYISWHWRGPWQVQLSCWTSYRKFFERNNWILWAKMLECLVAISEENHNCSTPKITIRYWSTQGQWRRKDVNYASRKLIFYRETEWRYIYLWTATLF